ncbi:MAG TPA: carboxypeptidase regulatory-like domain-containing protein, partial [Gemmatimonadaceae bacterium]|nr:carboxypeptidase regulatory-like domain-containing protein [Gemmatimonadaceae bacterium]
RDAAAPSRTATPVPDEIAASAAPTAPPPPSVAAERRLNRASVRDDAPLVAGGSVATGAAAKAAPSAAIGNVASDAMARERAVTGGAVAAAPSMMQAAPRRVAVVVAGYVYDADSRRPVEGAQVRVVSAGLGALSDSTGRYAIAGVAPGSRVVEARRIGYQARSSTVTVSADADTAIGPDFALASAATTLTAVQTIPPSGYARAKAAAKAVAPPRVAGCYDLSASPSSLGLPPRIVLDTAPAGAVRAPAGATPLGYARAYWREPATAGDSVIVYLLDARDAGVAVRARVDASSGRLRGTASLVEPGRPDVALSGAVVGARCGGTPR